MVLEAIASKRCGGQKASRTRGVLRQFPPTLTSVKVKNGKRGVIGGGEADTAFAFLDAVGVEVIGRRPIQQPPRKERADV